MLREVVAWFVLVTPLLIIVADVMIWFSDPYATITMVVRSWAMDSVWPETVYVLGTLVLYLHFFRNFPECFWR